MGLLIISGVMLVGVVGLMLVVVLPGVIAESRKAYHIGSIRKVALLGVVIAAFGFIAAILSPFRPVPVILIVGSTPGAIVWLVALIWSCLDKRGDTVRGFEVGPLPPQE